MGFDRVEKSWRALVVWIESQDNGKEDGNNCISSDRRGGNNNEKKYL